VFPQRASGFWPGGVGGRVCSGGYNNPLNKTDPLGLRATDCQFSAADLLREADAIDSGKQYLGFGPAMALEDLNASRLRTLGATAASTGSCVLDYLLEGDGRAVTLHGNLRAAQHVAILVPGTDTTIDNFSGVDQDAKRLREEARPSSSTAVIAWLDYDAPEMGLSVLRDGRAKAGAPNLAELLGSLGGKHVTVSAHSYGGLVPSKAITGHGASVDDLILLGSPGVLQDNVSAFGGARVWVGAAEGDPIPNLAGNHIHGKMPQLPSFGATRICTTGASGHSQYYQRGTESLANVARIVTARYDEVGVCPHGG
jgi:hypothetical protein